jgi:hypothetical protein
MTRGFDGEPLRSRLRKTLLSGTDAKIARQQRQLDAHAKELVAQATKQSKQLEAIRVPSAKAAESGMSLKESAEGLATRITALETGPTRRGIEVERRRAQLGAIEERLGRIDATRCWATLPGEDMDHDTAVAVLTEIEHLATTKLASTYVDSDRHPPVYDPQTKTVALPEAFKALYAGPAGLRLRRERRASSEPTDGARSGANTSRSGSGCRSSPPLRG